MRDHSLDCVIVSDEEYARFTDHSDRYPKEADFYSTFFSENDLIKEFVPDGINVGGPTISIYRIIKQQVWEQDSEISVGNDSRNQL